MSSGTMIHFLFEKKRKESGMRFNFTFHHHLTFSPVYIPTLSHYKLKDKCINLQSEQGHFKMTDAAKTSFHGTTFLDKINA